MNIFDKIGHEAAAFWNEHLRPWLKHMVETAVHDEVAALQPIASAAAGRLASSLATNLAKGDLKGFAASAGVILMETAEQAEVASIKAGGASLMAAVSGAIFVHAQAVGLGGEAPPAMPPVAGPGVNDQAPPALSQDGPTLAEYFLAGYDPASYPPKGYAAKPYTDEEMDTAKAAFSVKGSGQQS